MAIVATYTSAKPVVIESRDREVLLNILDDLNSGKDEEIARKLAANEIVVYAVHVADGNAPPAIATITSITGGEIFSAGDPQALKTIFKRIDEMQQAPIKRLTPDPVDFFQPFTITALSLGALWLLTLFGFRYNPW